MAQADHRRMSVALVARQPAAVRAGKRRRLLLLLPGRTLDRTNAKRGAARTGRGSGARCQGLSPLVVAHRREIADTSPGFPRTPQVSTKRTATRLSGLFSLLPRWADFRLPHRSWFSRNSCHPLGGRNNRLENDASAWLRSTVAAERLDAAPHFFYWRFADGSRRPELPGDGRRFAVRSGLLRLAEFSARCISCALFAARRAMTREQMEKLLRAENPRRRAVPNSSPASPAATVFEALFPLHPLGRAAAIGAIPRKARLSSDIATRFGN